MSILRKNLVLVAIILVCVGAFIGRETVEVDRGDGKWERLESRFRPVWERGPSAQERTDLQEFAAVRVDRWYCYGLWFVSSFHHRSVKSAP